MKYILYCRKSTDSEDHQVQSLDSQEKELLDIAARQGLEIVKVLKESKSAKKEGRPVFATLLAMMYTGEADAILCWKLDRIARNMADAGRVIELLQRGVIKEIRTHDAIHRPADNVLMLAVQLGMANQYSRDLSENVKRGNRTKLEKGDWPCFAPFGYKNDRVNKTILVDEPRAHYIRRAYELYATGGYSLRQIADILYAEGFRSKVGRKVYNGHIHNFLRSKFYIGLMERQGKLYQGNHTPLVSRALYDRVQEVLEGKLHPCYKTHFYSARGFLKCAHCGCMITATTAKGRKYYYCTNGKGGCEAHKNYLREKDINEMVSKLFLELKFDEEFIRLSGEAYRQEHTSISSYDNTRVEALESELSALSDKESRLTDSMASGVLKSSLYEEKMREVENQRVELKSQLQTLGTTKKPTVTFEQVRDVFLEGSRAAKRYVEVDEAEKRKMLEKLLSNAVIREQEVAQFLFKSPYQSIALTPKNCDFLTMCSVLVTKTVE